MQRRNEHPDHASARLRPVVEACVPVAEDRERYLAFTRELYISLLREPGPDFSRQTKRVVQKWFERGLSGHVMWLIGESIMRGGPGAGTEACHGH